MAIYVMSDIHGQMQRFLSMLDKIQFNKEDHIYILGDVIDRGEDGIAILEYIKKNEQITLLMGNHEKMMIDCYLEESKAYPDFYYEAVWFQNGGFPTKKAFDRFYKQKQEDFMSYLISLPLAITDLKVNGKTFYLAHASFVRTLTNGTYYLYSYEVTRKTTHTFLWERILYDTTFFDDRCVISGHTMTYHYQFCTPYSIYSDHEDLTKAKWINLDCGCAANNEYSRLSALRLDDMQVFYV